MICSVTHRLFTEDADGFTYSKKRALFRTIAFRVEWLIKNSLFTNIFKQINYFIFLPARQLKIFFKWLKTPPSGGILKDLTVWDLLNTSFEKWICVKLIKINTIYKDAEEWRWYFIWCSQAAVKDFERQQQVLQKTRVWESRKRNDILYVVNSKNALQISLESHSKATVRGGAKTSQIQIPVNTNNHYTSQTGRVKAVCCILFKFVLITSCRCLLIQPWTSMGKFSSNIYKKHKTFMEKKELHQHILLYPWLRYMKLLLISSYYILI